MHIVDGVSGDVGLLLGQAHNLGWWGLESLLLVENWLLDTDLCGDCVCLLILLLALSGGRRLRAGRLHGAQVRRAGLLAWSYLFFLNVSKGRGLLKLGELLEKVFIVAVHWRRGEKGPLL